MEIKISRIDKEKVQEKMPGYSDNFWRDFWEWFFHMGEFDVMKSVPEHVEHYQKHVTHTEHLLDNPKEFLKELSELYAEHRSDVSQIIDDYLIEDCFSANWKHAREHRNSLHIFSIPTLGPDPILIAYDTLTTEAVLSLDYGVSWIKAADTDYTDEMFDQGLIQKYKKEADKE